MRFNLVDIVVLAYLVYGIFVGMRRGLAQELPWAVSWAVCLFTGYGLITWSARGLTALSEAAGFTLGISGMALLIVAAYLMSRAMKRRIRRVIEKRYADPRTQRVGGMVAGGLRALLLSCFVIVFLAAMPIHAVRAPMKKGSFVGRILKHTVLPVYKAAHEPRPTGPSAATNAPPRTNTSTSTVWSNVRSKQF